MSLIEVEKTPFREFDKFSAICRWKMLRLSLISHLPRALSLIQVRLYIFNSKILKNI